MKTLQDITNISKYKLNKDYCYFNGGMYIKIGTDIYQLIKTPYKELPIFNIETKLSKEEEKKEE